MLRHYFVEPVKLANSWKLVFAPSVDNALVRKAPAVVNVLIVALLAYTAAAFTWRLIPGPQENLPLPTTTTSGQITRVDQRSLGQEIAKRHLFGQANAAATMPQAKEIPETRLNLVLRGVMAWEDQLLAAAIIADSTGKEAYYGVGGELPGDARLEEVHATHIVLSRSGRHETLKLPKETLKTGAAATLPPAIAPTLNPPPGASLREYRDNFLRNPASLAGVLNGQPVQENNGIIGFRISPGRDPSLMMRLGLQPGDVVTTVNGRSLGNPNERIELLREISQAQQLDLSILRNGAPMSFSLHLDQ